ncbi:MAG: hypothetical protein QNK23_10515 [Crocinitomicaceae bacterium]|nr:hypothetical protein [Crocinitomicaceae bacterium]
MIESSHRKWDIRIKIATSIIGLGVLITGLVQYSIDNQRTYVKVLYDNQFNLYNDLLSVSSEVALLEYDSLLVSNPSEFPEAKREFLKFYYGNIILIENREVEIKMIELKKKLEEFEDEDVDEILATMGEIRVICGHLALACRYSLEETWGIKLDALELGKKQNL